MNPTEVIEIYLSELLQKFSKEDKTIILMGDFNIDLFKYDHSTDSASFLDSLYANFLLPYISTPSRVTTHSRTLIDNIFSNNIEDGLISGNIISTISDHYAQFLLMKNMKIKQKETTDIDSHDFKNFNEVQFESELCNIDWKSVLEINKKDVDFSFSKFFETFNNLLQKHAPIKKLSNKDKKTMKKPWITKGILKSIEKKNRIYRKCIRTKNSTKKEELCNLFQSYRNSVNKIARLSEANHYKTFFEDNNNKLNKVWEGIKEIININKKNTQKIRNINNNGKLITEKKQIANIFNHFFL